MPGTGLAGQGTGVLWHLIQTSWGVWRACRVGTPKSQCSPAEAPLSNDWRVLATLPAALKSGMLQRDFVHLLWKTCWRKVIRLFHSFSTCSAGARRARSESASSFFTSAPSLSDLSKSSIRIYSFTSSSGVRNELLPLVLHVIPWCQLLPGVLPLEEASSSCSLSPSQHDLALS